jgi:hypothetical protein
MGRGQGVFPPGRSHLREFNVRAELQKLQAGVVDGIESDLGFGFRYFQFSFEFSLN